MSDFLAVAIAAATAAGALQRERFRRAVSVSPKATDDIVTDVDMRSEAAIIDRLGDAFPEHAVLAEESGARTGSAHRWIVDPLDGTTNFAQGIPHYSVAIALEIDGQLEVSVVYYPPLDDLYTAVRGEGARLNGSPISTSAVGTLEDALVALEYSPADLSDEECLGTIRMINRRARRTRHLGSSASELAMLASGTFDAFFGTRLRPWDAAAGHLLVAEAGGTITRVARSGDAVQYLASNGIVHDALSESILR